MNQNNSKRKVIIVIAFAIYWGLLLAIFFLLPGEKSLAAIDSGGFRGTALGILVFIGLPFGWHFITRMMNSGEGGGFIMDGFLYLFIKFFFSLLLGPFVLPYYLGSWIANIVG